MKTVHTRAMVAHLWANQSQETARTGNGSFFFEGKKIYSYGLHYLAAIITEWTHEGKTVVLINGEHYSSTTQRHISEIRRAIRGHEKLAFDVECMAHKFPQSMAASVLTYCTDEIKEKLKSLRDMRAEWKKRAVVERCENLALLVSIAKRYVEKGDTLGKRAILDAEKAISLIPAVIDKESIKRISVELSRVDDQNKVDALTIDIRDRLAAIAGFVDSKGELAQLGVSLPVANDGARYYIGNWDACENEARTVCHKRAQIVGICKLQGFKLPRALVSDKTTTQVFAYCEKRARVEWLQHLDAFCRRSIVAYKKGETIHPDSNLKLTQAKYFELSPQLQLAVDLARKAYAKQERARCLSWVKQRGAENARKAMYSARDYVARDYPVESVRYSYLACVNEYKKAQAITESLSDKARAYFMAGFDVNDINEAREFIENYDARKAEQNAQKITDWRSGAGTMTSARYLADFPLCRYNANSERLETSWGAEMPVKHARGVWLAIQRAKRTGKEYRPNNEGDKVSMGAFVLSYARPDGSIVAGCHNIPASELEYIAGVLGFTADNAETETA